MVSASKTDAAAPLLDERPNFNNQWRRLGRPVNAALEAERAQLPLWAVVSFGAGIAAWFALPEPQVWMIFLLVAGAILASGFVLGDRLGRALNWMGLLAALGLSLIWVRAEWVVPRSSRSSRWWRFDPRMCGSRYRCRGAA
ncbi:hypothetical protein [Sphingomicrobium lutaoense]|uniref:Uncharacterized membrane protein YdcZ (DUF606 family) n=1 Tax=Sphingomicrobium lutaoense TaxID=515949 RepID=A0A839YZV5_9SPHN|nr:hypothetical protein [Sphingomicrobium lutaoense]MBB3763858.1 uncharacterized membrane protein YdcZ (DUF606 family) [Sphingomicrobium lutaoense]